MESWRFFPSGGSHARSFELDMSRFMIRPQCTVEVHATHTPILRITLRGHCILIIFNSTTAYIVHHRRDCCHEDTGSQHLLTPRPPARRSDRLATHPTVLRNKNTETMKSCCVRGRGMVAPNLASDSALHYMLKSHPICDDLRAMEPCMLLICSGCLRTHLDVFTGERCLSGPHAVFRSLVHLIRNFHQERQRHCAPDHTTHSIMVHFWIVCVPLS